MNLTGLGGEQTGVQGRPKQKEKEHSQKLLITINAVTKHTMSVINSLCVCERVCHRM